MRDFKYRELVLENQEWEAVMLKLNDIKSPCLLPCRDAFFNNMLRTVLIPTMPTLTNTSMFMLGYTQALDMVKRTGRTDFSFSELLDWDISDTTHHEISARRAEASKDSLKRFLLKIGIEQTEILARKGDDSENCMDAMYSSIVTESCLYFESFVGDLWVVAVDNAGKRIVNRVNKHRKWANVESTEEEIKADDIEEDSRKKPGSFKRTAGHVRFTKLPYVEKFYAVAFGKKSKEIIYRNKYLAALYAVRNCFAHSAGIADRQFVDKMKHFSEFNSLKIGDKIELDGEIVKKLRNAATETGIDLLKFVDGQLLAESQ